MVQHCPTARSTGLLQHDIVSNHRFIGCIKSRSVDNRRTTKSRELSQPTVLHSAPPSKTQRQHARVSRSSTVSVQMSAEMESRNNLTTKLCTSLTAGTVQGMLAEAQEAQQAGADLVELRIDYLEAFSPEADLPVLIKGCGLPVIVTYRPTWEGYVFCGAFYFFCSN